MDKPKKGICFYLKDDSIIYFGGYCNRVEYIENSNWILAKNYSESRFTGSETTILGRIPYENILYIDYGAV